MNNKETEKIIEFEQIKELWMSYAKTEAARQLINQIKPYLNETELIVRLRETDEAKEMLEKCGNPPIVSLNNICEVTDIAVKGKCLSVGELIIIENALTAVKRLKQYLKKGIDYNIPLAYYEENLQTIEELRGIIAASIVNEEVSDNASKELKSIRMEISSTEDKMKEKAEAAIRSNKNYLSDSFTTIRSGHICIPVKKEYKNRILGNVIDKSSTGSTYFIEPESAAHYYEVLQYLKIDEANEVQRILYELSDMVGTYAEIINNNTMIMEKLDFIFSKGFLSLKYNGCRPEITQERLIKLTEARHPLMNEDKCVPLDFSIGNGVRGIVITGPNTGGKTVAIKTVAINCMMAQCGLHVACKEACICMHSNFLCDIGDGQNMSENLSTFSAHITNVLDILREVNKDSLVIMDELGSGTDPLEGMGIAVAILEELKNSKAFFLVTTHYPEVKSYAEKTDCIINARMTFDKEKLLPLYKMEIGEAGESCAFYIAHRLGMPDEMLQRASWAAYGKDICLSEPGNQNIIHKNHVPQIVRHKTGTSKKQIEFHRGDSVMIYPDKKLGIVCREANEKGVLQVQTAGKKIWINHKRVKLKVAATELYPEDYDFSIIFDSVETRKLRHKMERKYIEEEIELEE